MNAATETAIDAMHTTENNAGDYWNKCLAQRSAYESPCGSTYELTPIQLQAALLSSEWEEVSHSAVQAPCRAFKTQLAGKVGIVALDTLSPDMTVTMRDPKGTGEVEACIERANIPGQLAESTDTYMIAGMSDGKFMCFTFHPGEPIRPSVVKSEGNDGKVISVAEALTMGFQFAKVSG